MPRTSTPMVKIKPETHAKLQEMSREDNAPMGEIIGELVDRYERERFWRGAKEDLARLREKPAEYQAYKDEMEKWDSLANESLQNEPPFDEDEK